MSIFKQHQACPPVKRGRGRPPGSGKKTAKRNNPPSGSYKKIALIFVVCTILLILVITYFSLSKAKVTIVPDQEKKVKNIEIKIGQNTTDAQNLYLQGLVVVDKINESKNYPVNQGEKKLAKAKGEVKIINNHTESQTLVATTRLISESGVLFRTQKTVVVPAGGEIQVMIEADQPGESGNITPTQFSIPGLRENLRKKIYAVSEEPTSGGVVMVGTLTQEQIDEAAKELAEEIYENKLDQLETPDDLDKNKSEKMSTKKIAIYQTNQKIGEEIDNFDINLELDVARIWFDKKEVLEMAKQELKKQVENGCELISYDLDNFNYLLKNFDWQTGEANLEVVLGAWVKSKINLEKINKSEIKGMDKQALEAYFQPMNEVKEIKIRFWPFWVKTIPTLEDHIEIEIKE